MTPEQIAIVRLTFAQVMHQKDLAGRLFYERLFEIAPETRSLFKSDMDGQARKLMDTLGVAIASLRDNDALRALLQQIAARHVTYGARPEHYVKVGEALLWTLERALGPAFTPSAQVAWQVLYRTVSGIMLGARETPKAAARAG